MLQILGVLLAIIIAIILTPVVIVLGGLFAIVVGLLIFIGTIGFILDIFD